jgi:hypothetical protein
LRIVWNSFESAIPLDIGNDPTDFIVELSRPDGAQATIKSTQINGSGEVWLFVNGRPGGSGVKPEAVLVPNYAVRCYSYENDTTPRHEIPILNWILKGKTLRLTVDISL